MKIGILGGGQLAKMLALAASPLGIETLCYETKSGVSAEHVTDVTVGLLDDEATLIRFAKSVDTITFETENIPLETAQLLGQHQRLAPSSQALSIAQDRLLEKKFFSDNQISTAPFATVDSLENLETACESIGFPCILKTRRFGYDGKGQFKLNAASEVKDAWAAIGANSLLEGFIHFEREVSIVAVRNARGNAAFYPITENLHREGILRCSIAPFDMPALQAKAEQYAGAVLDAMDYVGVLAIEFFVVENDELIANEMAPRVHNTGHWTIEGAATSQFENHIRAICDLPLGSTVAQGQSAMFNFIGKEPAIESILAIKDAHFHSYHKEPRPNRKLGHVTLHSLDPEVFEDGVKRLKGLI